MKRKTAPPEENLGQAQPLPDYNCESAAVVLDCHPMTIRKKVAAGIIASYTVGRSRRITREEVNRIRHEGI